MTKPPGIYDIPEEEYHGDLTSLSSSGARKIMQECPSKFWYGVNNPEPASKALDFGKAAHCWLLERDVWRARHYVLPEGHNGTTKAGKIETAKAKESGKTDIKFDAFQHIRGMKEALEAHPYASAAFAHGEPEKSHYWRCKETDVMCRMRPDITPAHNGQIIADYKTTLSAQPRYLERKTYEYGYHMQAAWYLDGLFAAGYDDPEFYLVFQEKKPPYVITIIRPTDKALAAGEVLNLKAKDEFRVGQETGVWRDYVQRVIYMDLPPWADKQFDEENSNGLYDIEERENERQTSA